MTYQFIPYQVANFDLETQKERAKSYYQYMDTRRTVREYSDQEVPMELIENIIKTASTAPSGAHKQPWTFCVVKDPEMKKKIRIAAEKEEKESYESRMSERWKQDLEPLGTNWEKPFLEKAPYLIVVFKRVYEKSGDQKVNNYYVNESVGLACGFLINAIHNAGLATLTHTPSPMNFLAELLERPANERPFLLLPVGYPAPDAQVPVLERKPLDAVMKVY